MSKKRISAAAAKAREEEERRARAAELKKRVAFQREVFAKVAAGEEPFEVLQQAMLDRAWRLLEAGEFNAADALLEFVPEAAAEERLDAFFDVHLGRKANAGA